MTQSDHKAMIEDAAKKFFGRNLVVSQIVADEVDVARAVKASVFMTDKKQLYCYLHGDSRLLLADISKLISRMGLVAEAYLPPKGRATYFEDIGSEKFRKVFPGRGAVQDADIRYYRTLAPYNPALVHIREVKNGEIKQFDADARGGWRVSAKFAYRRIRTS